MAADQSADAGGGSKAPSGGGGKLVLIITILNLVLTLGIGGVVFISFNKEKKATSVEDIAQNEEGHGANKAEEGGGGHGEAKSESEGGDGHGETAKGEHKEDNFGKMLTLKRFTVNLSTIGSVNPKFARVDISLEVPTEDTESEVNRKMPQVRNTIIDLFNSKRPSDLSTPEGRTYLKDEIRKALNSFLLTGKVKGVFFTNFALSS